MIVSRPSPKVALPTVKGLVMAVPNFSRKGAKAQSLTLNWEIPLRLCAFAGKSKPEYTFDPVEK
jgi:hypothetical protein